MRFFIYVIICTLQWTRRASGEDNIKKERTASKRHKRPYDSFPSIPCSTNSPTHCSNTAWFIDPFSSKNAEYDWEAFVRPFARRDLPPLVERTYEMASWYEGALAGEGVVERVEGETGKVVELSWMRSPMICEGEGGYHKSDTASDVRLYILAWRKSFVCQRI